MPKKIYTLIFILSACITALVPARALAADDCTWGFFDIGLPGIGSPSTCIDTFASGDNPLIRFAAVIVNILIAAIVVAGLLSIVAGGYIYMTAGGSASRVGMAKTLIITSLGGITLALAVFLILTTISSQFMPTEDPPLVLYCTPGTEDACWCDCGPDDDSCIKDSTMCPSTGKCLKATAKCSEYR